MSSSLALLAILAAVTMACGVGSSAGSDASSNNNGNTSTTGSPAATTAPSDATDTPASVAPTPTHIPPTATPVPTLKSKIITQSLGTINASSNSAITDIVCPSGYLVAGGGPISDATNFTIMWNAPISTTTWRAEIYNDGASPITASVKVVCLAFSGLHGQLVTKSLGASGIGPTTNSSIVDIACPSGYLMAGGGPKSGYTNYSMMWDAPTSTTTWRGEIYNRSGSTIYVDMQVICLAVSGLHGQTVLKLTSGVGSGTNSSIVTIACPSGYLMAGGGINIGYSNVVLMKSAPATTTTMQMQVHNSNTGAISFQEQAICLKR